jgi:mRNA interferase HigB
VILEDCKIICLTKLLGPKLGPCYSPPVRVIALSTIKAFLNRGTGVADAAEPLMAWFRQARQADWAKPADIKRDIRSVSILKDGRAVFNIAGNKYRIVVWINYPYRVVYIRFIGTHRQYDAIDAQNI